MATSKSANTYNRLNWEDSEFPILCQTCLGDNPYLRMMKEKYGKECKICSRPFTIFRWCPGARSRFKKTEVCQTCSKLKNVCQTCLLDLDFGLPVQVRDSTLQIKDEIPKSEVNREFYQQNMEAAVSGSDPSQPYGQLAKAQAPSDVLMKLARTQPYYKRNRPHICSFWVKGECKRGEECPYRHEKPTDPDDPLADQNIKDRYYGVNDPVANKLLKRAEALPKLVAPDDRTITTLYIGNLSEEISEKDLRDYFYQFGEIRNVALVPRQLCAFVQFISRSSAEYAAEKSFNKLVIKNRRLTVRWGKSAGKQTTAASAIGAPNEALPPVPGLPGALPMPPKELQNNYFNIESAPPLPPPPNLHMLPPAPFPPNPNFLPPPPMFPGVHYPSQDPMRLGSVDKHNAPLPPIPGTSSAN